MREYPKGDRGSALMQEHQIIRNPDGLPASTCLVASSVQQGPKHPPIPGNLPHFTIAYHTASRYLLLPCSKHPALGLNSGLAWPTLSPHWSPGREHSLDASAKCSEHWEENPDVLCTTVHISIFWCLHNN